MILQTSTSAGPTQYDKNVHAYPDSIFRRVVFCLAVSALLLASLGADLSLAAEPDDLAVVRGRFLHWLLEDDATNYSHEFVNESFKSAIRHARQAEKSANNINFDAKAALYDTRKSGPDRREVHQIVTEVLPRLSVAYQLKGPKASDNPFYQNEETLALLIRAFDYLHERGFRPDMQMPWKAKDGVETEPPTAIIADFHLRTSGYALATLLMRDELRAASRLDRTLETCRAIAGHGEKTGDLGELKLNADGVRIAVNFVLPYALAANDTARLRRFKKQIDRSMAVESDASDTIKPDGLGFHHLGVYQSGYAPYAVAQAAQAAWLMRDTEYEVARETIENLRRSMLILRILSQKYDMHKALAGRLHSIAVIPNVMMGYAYLAAIANDTKMKRVLARLCDEIFLASDLKTKPFNGARDEAQPGPGAVDFFFKTLASANAIGPEADPVGHWALNYGPLSVHRRDNWMVSVKGFSKYFWAFERSLSDGLGEDRFQNVLGFHDSSFTIRIHSRGEPVSAVASGYVSDGWDWCHRPGATVRLIPAETMLRRSLELSRENTNRPFGLSGFAGGLSFSGEHGLFAMRYSESSCDAHEPRLQANKSVFFFDDQIVVLASDIRNGDGEFPVVTTLYQSGLSDPQLPTWTRDRSVTGLTQEERFDDGKPLTLIDPVGNGYFIPRAENVFVARRHQESLDYAATQKTVGDFALAWFDHGKEPQNVGCEYVVLVNSSPEALQHFARHADDFYQVLQRDSAAHIVTHKQLGLTGYAVFQENTNLPDGIIDQVDTPCLIMTRAETDSAIRLSVCNPDLGWTEGRQYKFRPKDREEAPPAVATATPVKITLRGLWQAQTPSSEITLRTRARSTVLRVNCTDGRSIEFVLLPGGK